jgi:hypothetical protein
LRSKCLVMQTMGNYLGLFRTWTFGGDLGEDVSGCHLDFQSFILFPLYVYLLVSLLWLVYIVKPLYYYSSVLKSTSFTLNSFPQSFLSILDLCCPSEIKTFRCYEGTAHKLRPSPFKINLWSPESIILLLEPNSISKLQLVPYSLWKLGQKSRVFLREFRLLPSSKKFPKPFLLLKELIQLFVNSS